MSDSARETSVRDRASVRNSLLVDRPRLRAAVLASLERGVAVISAPSGYGKTTLAESCIAGFGSVHRILLTGSSLMDVTRALISEVKPAALSSLTSVFQQSQDAAFLDLLIAWAAPLIEASVVVIDQFEKASREETTVKFFEGLIHETRARTQWIFVTQHMNAGRLRRWTQAGWMRAPVDAADLTFTSDEIRQLTDALLLDVPESGAVRLLELSGGWPLAVPIAIDLLARGLSLEVAAIRTTRLLTSHIQRFLADLTSPGRTALITATLLGRCSLSTLLSLDIAPEHLDDLRLHFPFVSFQEERMSVHAVVADCIDELFATEHIDAIADTLAENVFQRDPVAALGVALSRRRIAVLRRILNEHIEDLCLRHGALADASSGLDLLEEATPNDADILAMRGVVASLRGELARAIDYFERALPLSRGFWRDHALMRLTALNQLSQKRSVAAGLAMRQRSESPPLSAHWLFGIAKSIELNGAFEGHEAAARDLRLVADHIGSTSNRMKARIGVAAARAALSIGDFARAQSFAEISTDAATQLGETLTLAQNYSFRATLAEELEPNLAAAGEWETKSLRLYEESHMPAATMYLTMFNIVLNKINRGLPAEARALRERLDRLPTIYPPSRAAIQWAGILSLEGKPAASVLRLQRLSEEQTLADDVREMIDLSIAFYAAQAGDRALAESRVGRSSPTGQSAGFYAARRATILARARSLIFWALGKIDDANAEALMTRTVRQSVRERKMSGLLVELMQRGTDNDAIASIADDFEALDDVLIALFIRRVLDLRRRTSILTAAELAVLAEFHASGGTAAEVAKRLGRSTFTVQSQIRSSIKKLGCSGRAQAIQIAVTKGWL